MTDLFISHLSITGPHSFSSTLASINLFGKFSTLLNNVKKITTQHQQKQQKKKKKKKRNAWREEWRDGRRDERTSAAQIRYIRDVAGVGGLGGNQNSSTPAEEGSQFNFSVPNPNDLHKRKMKAKLAQSRKVIF